MYDIYSLKYILIKDIAIITKQTNKQKAIDLGRKSSNHPYIEILC